MSLNKRTQSWIEHTYWIENGDSLPWTRDGAGLLTAFDGDITSEFSGDNNPPSGSELVHATAKALSNTKTVFIEPPNGTPAIALRFRSDGSADDANILDLYACAGVDHYQHIAQLTLAQGTQLHSGSIYFNDGVTPANEKWYSTVSELTGTGNNVGGYVFNTHGCDSFLIVASDLVTTTCYVDWRIIP